MTLPKFLLAWSDFNWFWVYRWLRPARDARWSLSRLLLLSVLNGALGALMGLLLGLAVFERPVGWLPWLAGLFGLCAGLCWFGVTAICWNQRAAQLRANPAPPTGLPKARYPFFRWCLGLVYFVILGVITPLALLVTVENVRGEIAWKRERARLVAAGEKLTFREILGPDMPPEQNAGAAPVFAPFFNYQHHPPKKVRVADEGATYFSGLVWYDSNELARIDLAFSYLDSTLNKQAKQTRGELTPKVDLTEWSAAYREFAARNQERPDPLLGTLEVPADTTPALNVLASQRPAKPVLDEIGKAAALPRSQFPVHYDEAFEALLRHLSTMKAVQQALLRRCAAHLALGDTSEAFADATNALNVAELLREEPLLISQLVRYAQLNITVSTIWQGLDQHAWSDAQLAVFQSRLAQIEFLPGMIQAFEGERAAGILGVDKFINYPASHSAFFGEKPPFAGLMAPATRGLMRQNQVVVAEYHTRNLQPLRDCEKKVHSDGLVALIDEQRTEYLAMELAEERSPYHVIAAMLLPALGKAIDKTAKTQTTLELAITACALERYRLAHGEFPERLEQLVPQFCASVPLDPMIKQPFRYRRTDDGWFLLYSVGLNGMDEGGAMRSEEKADKEEKDWPWPVSTQPAKVRLF